MNQLPDKTPYEEAQAGNMTAAITVIAGVVFWVGFFAFVGRLAGIW